MAKEIERKFLVKGNHWRKGIKGISIRQGYFPTGSKCTVRVRVAGKKAYLTVKGKTTGISRAEYEYPIPVKEANKMINGLCVRPFIEKTRFEIKFKGNTWEVDVFKGENKGLILAEVELSKEDKKIEFPEWIGEEVSHDSRYFNVKLVSHPFVKWKKMNLS